MCAHLSLRLNRRAICTNHASLGPPRREARLTFGGPRFGLVLASLLLLAFATIAWPDIEPGEIPGGDAVEYVHVAAALLHGTHLVDYDGPPRPTRYTPGFPLMLAPAVAVGGLEAAVWVSYLAALVLGALAALLAFTLGGGLAAPLAVVLVLFTPAGLAMARIIMSDLPSATLVLAEAALLALATSRRSAVAAGLLAGWLVWMRPASIVLILAGLAGLSATRRVVDRSIAYIAGVVVPVVLLGLWQWSVFGSPLLTSYQVAGASGGGSSEFDAFFSLGYVLGPPWNAYSQGAAPNLIVYVRGLLGLDAALVWPATGLVGLVSASLMARSRDARGCVGRFTLAASLLTLLVYVPYFFREPRFLIVPAVLNGVTAAVLIGGLIPRALGGLRANSSAACRRWTRRSDAVGR